MNNKGFLSIEFLFSIFILLTIAIGFIFYEQNIAESNNENILNVESRLFLDNIADDINQVNANGEGYTKIIKLPDKLDNYSYALTVNSNEIILEVSNKKAKSEIFPISLVNSEALSIDEVKLFHGENYQIEKLKDNKITFLKV